MKKYGKTAEVQLNILNFDNTNTLTVIAHYIYVS